MEVRSKEGRGGKEGEKEWVDVGRDVEGGSKVRREGWSWGMREGGRERS